MYMEIQNYFETTFDKEFELKLTKFDWVWTIDSDSQKVYYSRTQQEQNHFVHILILFFD